MSGTYIIEDVENNDGEVYRRLYFLATQSVVQSEAKLKTSEFEIILLLVRNL